ncbi:MAG: hypothetical protein HY457_03335 [Parcubacteria group bacterium]|nr:hypothetical protein [Parcubacteria group bacterium]
MEEAVELRRTIEEESGRVGYRIYRLVEVPEKAKPQKKSGLGARARKTEAKRVIAKIERDLKKAARRRQKKEALMPRHPRSHRPRRAHPGM